MKPIDYIASERRKAGRRGHEWTITEEEAIGLTQLPCSYCGEAPHEGLGGIDRVDNTRGYVAGNCAPCCGWCNALKGRLTKDEFLRQVERVHAHQSALPV